MRARLPAVNGRREAIYVALAAAEACWVTPIFLALTQRAVAHPPPLLWLGILVLFLGYHYFYRALVQAELSQRAQQGVLVAALLVSIGLVLRFHVYAGSVSGAWLLEPLRLLVDLTAVMPRGWMAIMLLIYLWARGIHLARRSLSVDSVGFSFRAGVVILVLASTAIGLFGGGDPAAFVAPFFFFALAAVALARVEEVSLVPNSSGAGFHGFWVGSTLGAVALLVLLGMVAGAFFSGGGFRQILAWLSPVLFVLSALVVGLGVLLAIAIEQLFALLSIDLTALGQRLREVFQALGALLLPPEAVPPPGSEGQTRPAILAILQGVCGVGVPALIIAFVVLYTWGRIRRARRDEREESRESTFSAGAVARSLQDMLRAGRDRLGELLGLVDRFGLGPRFLSAVSIRRIYANLVRLAAGAGYPRVEAQTPYEYLETLYEALPGSEADVRVITDAYVNAHYGQVPDSREELQRIRDCWERVRTRGAGA